MRRGLWYAWFGAVAATVAAVFVACGDDDALVRQRLDGGADGAAGDGGDAAACAITFPTDYVSPAFESNASVELALRQAFDALVAPMIAAESAQPDGGAYPVVTKVKLDGLWQGGNPSIKSITTSYYQTRISGWLGAYEAATDAGAFDLATDSPPPSGGYYGRYVYDGSMLDLRQAIEKGTYAAGFYNHAIAIVSGANLTEASIDRLVAAWGAHPTFQNNHQPTSGATDATKDVNAAGYAAQRTPKDPGKTGPYLRAKDALIKAKAAIAAGATCDAVRDAAIKVFLLEWEKATYATVVHDFDDIVTKLSATPSAGDVVTWSDLFHEHGECIGFIAGFKTIPQEYRKITDAQIDGLLTKALAPDGAAADIVKLKTAPTASAIGLNGAISDIKAIYGFTDDEMESFKVVYTKP